MIMTALAIDCRFVTGRYKKGFGFYIKNNNNLNRRFGLFGALNLIFYF